MAEPILGFLSPSGRHDPSPQQVQAVFDPPGVRVQQTVIFPDPVAEAPSSGARPEPQPAPPIPSLEMSATLLAGCGCAAIGLVGLAAGYSPSRIGRAAVLGAQAKRVRLTQAALGTPVETEPLALVEAANALGINRLALAGTDLSSQALRRWAGFMTAAGYQIVHGSTLADLADLAEAEGSDLSGSPESRLATGPGVSSEAGPTEQAVAANVHRAADSEAQAVLVAGNTVPLLGPFVAQLSRDIARPVIGTHTALAWALAARVGLPVRQDALGPLTGVAHPCGALVPLRHSRRRTRS